MRLPVSWYLSSLVPVLFAAAILVVVLLAFRRLRLRAFLWIGAAEVVVLLQGVLSAASKLQGLRVMAALQGGGGPPPPAAGASGATALHQLWKSAIVIAGDEVAIWVVAALVAALTLAFLFVLRREVEVLRSAQTPIATRPPVASGTQAL